MPSGRSFHAAAHGLHASDQLLLRLDEFWAYRLDSARLGLGDSADAPEPGSFETECRRDGRIAAPRACRGTVMANLPARRPQARAGLPGAFRAGIPAPIAPGARTPAPLPEGCDSRPSLAESAGPVQSAQDCAEDSGASRLPYSQSPEGGAGSLFPAPALGRSRIDVRRLLVTRVGAHEDSGAKPARVLSDRARKTKA
jgi:hypothetical protein